MSTPELPKPLAGSWQARPMPFHAPQLAEAEWYVVDDEEDEDPIYMEDSEW
jgi:hypothetical protein